MTVYLVEWLEFYASAVLAVVSDREIADLVIADYIDKENKNLDRIERQLREANYVEERIEMVEEIIKELGDDGTGWAEQQIQELEDGLVDRWELVDDEERPHVVAELKTDGESLIVREFKLNQYNDKLFI